MTWLFNFEGTLILSWKWMAGLWTRKENKSYISAVLYILNLTQCIAERVIFFYVLSLPNSLTDWYLKRGISRQQKNKWSSKIKKRQNLYPYYDVKKALECMFLKDNCLQWGIRYGQYSAMEISCHFTCHSFSTSLIVIIIWQCSFPYNSIGVYIFETRNNF